MSSRMNFMLGLVMLVVAATAAVTIGTRDASRPHSQVEAEEARRSQPHSAFAGQPATSPRTSGSFRQSGSSGEMLIVTIDPQHPDRDQLEPLARQVESHARQRLARMTRELDLSVDQQRRIFPKLVHTSQSYHPAMMVGGVIGAGPAPGGFEVAPVESELDPVQRGQLVESSINDLMLWREIIAQLESRLHLQTPEPVGGNAPRTASEPSGGGRNLFDMIPAAE